MRVSSYGDPMFFRREKLPLSIVFYILIILIFSIAGSIVGIIVGGIMPIKISPIISRNTTICKCYSGSTILCTLFVDKILYRRMHEDKMRGGLPALIRPRIV